MTYLPPFARMRQILRDTVRPEREPVAAEPTNVVEALAQVQEVVLVVEEPVAPEVVEVEAPVAEEVIEVEAPVVEEAIEEAIEVEAPVKKPSRLSKKELVVLAANHKIPISDEMTANQIRDALIAAKVI